MIEVVPGTIEGGDPATATPLSTSGGTKVTLVGKIVNSKCYLGVMNPGGIKPRRACAIQCIQGSIPPILVAQNDTGERRYYLLVGPEGQALNREILNFIAEPVSISGTFKRIGDRNVRDSGIQSISRL
jgi:hypothetical protein